MKMIGFIAGLILGSAGVFAYKFLSTGSEFDEAVDLWYDGYEEGYTDARGDVEIGYGYGGASVGRRG